MSSVGETVSGLCLGDVDEPPDERPIDLS